MAIRRQSIAGGALLCLLAACRPAGPTWWKGNTHTHTLWSDGNAAPEHVADWYVKHGYHFLVLSDHNILSQDERWVPVSQSTGGSLRSADVVDLEDRFGPGWVVERREGVRHEMKLKTLPELAAKFDLRACWSQPILSASNQLLGTFAMYYREPRGPTKHEVNLIEQSAILAAIAIERHDDEEIVRHSDRLASLGTLAAGIAHEINNPIGAIQLAAQNATNALAKGNMEGVRSMLAGITVDTERCARVIRGVLQFGRRSGHEKQPISLRQIVAHACELCRPYATDYPMCPCW